MNGSKLEVSAPRSARRPCRACLLGVGAAIALAATAGADLPAAAEAPSQGPAFVGCASDGMAGPVAAPKTPANMAPPPAGLAVYASDAMTALAPIGWSCFSLYGSSGSSLIVTPEAHTRDDFIERELAVSGPAVMVIRFSGDTSGRFLAAAIDAQVFPIARRFVARVKAEGLTAPGDIPAGPFPTDRIKRLSATAVDYETPAARNGLGVSERFKAGDLPMRGAAILLPKEQMDVVLIAVRLAAGLDALTPQIVQSFERDHGSRPTSAGAH
jgi:hypothetical protein